MVCSSYSCKLSSSSIPLPDLDGSYTTIRCSKEINLVIRAKVWTKPDENLGAMEVRSSQTLQLHEFYTYFMTPLWKYTEIVERCYSCTDNVCHLYSLFPTWLWSCCRSLCMQILHNSITCTTLLPYETRL